MFWVLKRTVSMRRFLRVPSTYVLVEKISKLFLGYALLTKGLYIISYLLSVNEKLLVSKFRYFRKYIIQLFGYGYVYVSGQRQAGLER